MTPTPADLAASLLTRLREVQARLSLEPAADADVPLAEAVDSMGLVEFLAAVAHDWGVGPEAIEEAVGRRFGTVAQLAAALHAAGLGPRKEDSPQRHKEHQEDENEEIRREVARPPVPHADAWLASTASRLPATLQPAGDLDALLGKPAGWLEAHAGVRSRRVWGGEDALAAATQAGRDCLAAVGMAAGEVGALLVTAEAPPLLVGLGAALHARLGLAAGAVALEVGGACTGFVAALYVARRLLPEAGAVLVVAVEAASAWLGVRPGAAGEAAALFGDGAGVCLLTAAPAGPAPRPLVEVHLGADGAAGHLLRARHVPGQGVELAMDGPELATRAVRALAGEARGLVGRHGLKVEELAAVVVHGGNGRLPALVARQLGLSPDKVWSQTAETGNLGAASLPVAWAAREAAHAPAVWAAVGAGLTWGAVLLGAPAAAGR